MPNLTDLVQVIPATEEEEPEDFFASAPGFLFTDDLRNQHGDPGSVIVYKNGRFGNLELRTADPEAEDERQLFSHYLWNAAVKLAELMSFEGEDDGDRGAVDARWSVKGERVLELGAGVGLGGIVATLAGAAEVAITDYPAPVVLDNLRRNVRSNVPPSEASSYTIQGHAWGDLSSSFASSHGRHFTRILAADCFWMPHQHRNLVDSMLHFLSDEPDAQVFALAGFHTGRANLANFFEEASEQGLVAEELYEENAEGVRREWLKERDGGAEHHGERKKWLVIGILKRRD